MCEVLQVSNQTLQSWTIIKSPDIYTVNFGGVFVGHVFQLKNRKCFTKSTQVTTIPSLEGLVHGSSSISRALLTKKEVNFLSEIHMYFS